MINKIHLGDCLEIIKTFPDNCIDLTVTSPPYDNLRTYNGYVFDFEGIAKELYRITKSGGVIVWVVGDATINGSETGTSFKQALYFKDIGFNLHDTMIYDKDSQGARGSNNSYWQSFEYMFIFSKGKPKSINLIKDRSNKLAGNIISGTNRQKDGSTKKHWASGKIVSDFSKRTNIWHIYNRTNSKHPATFPERLAEDHILSWSKEGDTVLDPMAGSGTTLKMAKKNNRNYIGIEISEEYCDIIKNRLENQ